MPDTAETPPTYDVFRSHGSPDKPWVRTLRDELVKLGLSAFLDESELETGENWTLRLSRELRQSRALALVISAETLKRPWVEHEWTSFLAEHGPHSGRLISVLLDPVDLPTFLKPLQGVVANHRQAARVAQELAAMVGRFESMPEGDVRRLFIGQDLVFSIDRLDDGRLAVTDPTGRRREVPAPGSQDTRFTAARIVFDRLARDPVRSEADRAALHGHAATLGGHLFELLFDEMGLALLRDASSWGRVGGESGKRVRDRPVSGTLVSTSFFWVSGEVTSTTSAGRAPSAATSSVLQGRCRFTPKNTATSGHSSLSPGRFQSTPHFDSTIAVGSLANRALSTPLRYPKSFPCAWEFAMKSPISGNNTSSSVSGT